MLRGNDLSYAILTVRDGFFNGFNRPVALGSVVVVAAVIFWIIALPDQSTQTLAAGKAALLAGFRGWFLYCLGGMTLCAVVFACLPVAARLRMAADETVLPRFPTGSWLGAQHFERDAADFSVALAEVQTND